MSEVFLQVFNLSLAGSWVILLVLLARVFLRKSPRWCSYLLWGVVFLRLMLPVVPQSRFGLVPAGLQVSNEAIEQVLVADDAMNGQSSEADAVESQSSSGNMAGVQGSVSNAVEVPDSVGDVAAGQSGTASLNGIQETAKGLNVLNILAWLWLAGAVGFGGYHAFSYYKFKRRIKEAVHVSENIYEIQSEHLSFVAGIFKPAIYLSGKLDEESRKVVLCHEQVHLKRRDYLAKPMALAITCIHWFNPLVWLAFYLMNRDCEISCDEKVVSILGEESKKVYSYALLDEATGGARRSGRYANACAVLSFGEDSIKSRIKHVLSFRKAPVWLIGGSVVVLVILAAGLLSNRGENIVAEEYANIFEYAVSLTDEKFAYTPAQVSFGMTLEELLQDQNLDESAILDGYAEGEKVVQSTEILRNVLPNTEELVFGKQYRFAKEDGLVSVTYFFTMDREDKWTFLRMMYDQAVEYMPELSTLDSIKSGTDTMWDEIEWDKSEGFWIDTDGEIKKINRSSAVHKSHVRISTGSTVGETSTISLTIGYRTEAERELLLRMNLGVPTEEKPVEILSATDWQEYTVDEAEQAAVAILHGKVMEKLETHEEDGMWREVVVEVQEVLRGEESREWVLYREPGGETKETVYVYEGVESVEVGAEYIFFTTNPTGVYENPKLVMPYSAELAAEVKAQDGE